MNAGIDLALPRAVFLLGMSLGGSAHAAEVVEFYNTVLDNYFITANADEAAAIGIGAAGPGWIRTGYAFNSGGTTPVCRFYGSISPGPNSHFYTVNPNECQALRDLQAITPATQSRWNFESLDFLSTPTGSGTCPEDKVPIYRAYNNGFGRGIDSNHRIVNSPAAMQEVVNRGWKDEGIVMCAPAVALPSKFVSPVGDDANPGTIDQPYRTIQKCASTATAGTACQVRAGTYRETVTPNSGITITAFNNEVVTIDGADPVTGWTPHQGAIYQASVALAGDDTNQVFVGDEMMTEARWPNGDDLFHPSWAVAGAGTTATKIADSRLPHLNWQGARVHIWSGTDPWAPMSATVTAAQAGELSLAPDGAPIGDSIALIPGGYYFLFGSLAALDAEREWHYDKATGTLYFRAPGGVDPNTLAVRAKRRATAFDLGDKSDVTIRNIRIFASTVATNALSARIVLDGISATYPSHYTAFADAPAQPGSGGYAHVADSGIILKGDGHTLQNSTISFSAGNGVVAGGTNLLIQNNLIHHIDYAGNWPAGITILNSASAVTVRRNTIHTSGRTLMHLKPWQNPPAIDGLEIGYNNLYGAMHMSRDGGAIYTGAPPSVTRSRMHHNWIHDTQDAPGPVRNWSMTGVYLDEGSSGWLVDQNVLWNNPGFSINQHGNTQGRTDPVSNNIRNNTVVDVAARSYILLNDLANCGTTRVADNLVLVPVVQTGANCAVSNNGPLAPGANEMIAAVQVGCNLAGCASSAPPAVIDGLVAASITTQPHAIAVVNGAPASFEVVGAGSAPLTYQWQRNGANIAGATSAAYALAATSAADNGALFTVQVANAAGRVTSDPALLTVR